MLNLACALLVLGNADLHLLVSISHLVLHPFDFSVPGTHSALQPRNFILQSVNYLFELAYLV